MLLETEFKDLISILKEFGIDESSPWKKIIDQLSNVSDEADLFIVRLTKARASLVNGIHYYISSENNKVQRYFALSYWNCFSSWWAAKRPHTEYVRILLTHPQALKLDELKQLTIDVFNIDSPTLVRGGSTLKKRILGRERKIVKQGRKQMIIYKGAQGNSKSIALNPIENPEN